MTVGEFEGLSEMQQLDTLQKHGVYIGKSVKHEQTVLLMQLDSFYVELYYNEYRRDLQKIRTFSSPDEIDEYLKWINIKNLRS